MKSLASFLLCALIAGCAFAQEESLICDVSENYYGITHVVLPREKVPAGAVALTGIKTGCEGCFQSAMEASIPVNSQNLSIPVLVDTRVRRKDFSTTCHLSFSDANNAQLPGVDSRISFHLVKWVEIQKHGIEVVDCSKNAEKQLTFAGQVLIPGPGSLAIQISKGTEVVKAATITQKDGVVELKLAILPVDVGMYSVEAVIQRNKEQHIENWMVSVTDSVIASPFLELGACIQETESMARVTLKKNVIISKVSCSKSSLKIGTWKQEDDKLVLPLTPIDSGILTGWIDIIADDKKSRIPFTLMSVGK